ncbi:MAG: hypothetical protein JJT94_02185 [Bernardetiaceae bacterium]|nr:hypothetical protein [Bernardetiaceae bacterium]
MTKYFFSFLLFFVGISTCFAQTWLDVTQLYSEEKIDEAHELAQNILAESLCDSVSPAARIWLSFALIKEQIYRDSTRTKKNPEDFYRMVNAFKHTRIAKDSTISSYTERAELHLRALYADHLNAGVQYFEAQQFEQAIASFAQARFINPMDTLSLLYALQAAQRWTNPQKLKQIAFDLLQNNYESALIYQILIEQLTQDKSFEQALYLCQIGAQKFPNMPYFEDKEVEILGQTHRFDRLLPKIEQKLEKKPNHINYLIYGTQTAIALKNWDDAENYIKRIAEIRQDTSANALHKIAEMYYNEGLRYYKQETKTNEKQKNPTFKALFFFEKALPYIQKIQTENPESEVYTQALELIEEQQKRREKWQRKKDRHAQYAAAPTIVITTFNGDSLLNDTDKTSLEMQGLVIAEETPLYLKINEMYAEFTSEERFKISYPLYEGRNQLKLKTKDANGRQAQLDIEITRNAQTQTETQTYTLFFVPNNEYKYIEKDSAAKSDLQQVTKLWEVLYSDYEGFDSSRYYLLAEKQATKDRLLQTLKNISKEIRPQDKLLIVFAGRGHINWASGETYRLPYEARKLNSEDLADAYIMSQLLKINARNILIINNERMLPNYTPLRRQGLLAEAGLFRSFQILSTDFDACQSTLSYRKKPLLSMINSVLANEQQSQTSAAALFLRLNIMAEDFVPALRQVREGEQQGGEFWFVRKKN